MNSFTLFLILFIIPFTAMVKLEVYSIDSFKERMKKEGLFDIIQSIKDVYGQDVAIISCEELNKNYSGNCKRLVTEYMDSNKDIDKREIEIPDKGVLTKILLKNYTPEESNLLSDRIIQSVKSNTFLFQD